MSLSEYPVSQTASTIKLYQNNANEIEILFTNYKHVLPTYSMNSCFVEWIEIGTLAVFVSTAYVSIDIKRFWIGQSLNLIVQIKC